jgi:hypothetical protein
LLQAGGDPLPLTRNSKPKQPYDSRYAEAETELDSSHGQCKTLDESREWMKQRATGDNVLYAIHVKSEVAKHSDTRTEELELVGNCGLRRVTSNGMPLGIRVGMALLTI